MYSKFRIARAMPGSAGRACAVLTFLTTVSLTSILARAQWCGEWTQVATTGPVARQFHAMAYDSARGVTVLFGGKSKVERLGDTWEWDGSEWRRVADTGPQARGNCAMAYDSDRGVTVLFGGTSNGVTTLGDTWEWNGQVWTKVADSGPTPRLGQAMTYDSTRGAVVMFGGWNDSQKSMRDTWEWNGYEWRHASDDGPSQRSRAGLTFDDQRNVTTLFGGFSSGTTYGDTWEWEGVEWVHRTNNGPDNRSHTALAYDKGHALSVLFSGWDGDSSLFDDTWGWDGSEWAEVLTNDGPEPRDMHAMVFDSVREVFVLFGGGGGPLFGDTWELHLTCSARIIEQPQDLIVVSGDPAEFSIAVEFPDDVSYQWRRDGIPLDDGGNVSGSTTDTLTIRRVFRLDSSDYDCVVTNACGELVSEPGRLFVIDPALEVESSCPDGGPVTVKWDYCTPDGEVVIFHAKETGFVRIPPGYPCGGTWLLLGPLGRSVVWRGFSGPDGSRVLHASTGPKACDSLLQLLDLTTCETSELMLIE